MMGARCEEEVQVIDAILVFHVREGQWGGSGGGQRAVNELIVTKSGRQVRDLIV